ncbi:MAG: hypothetical protein N2235_18120 [Fischerella sp.]|nr:hypothetical protein [Fischerella sp.]
MQGYYFLSLVNAIASVPNFGGEPKYPTIKLLTAGETEEAIV